jgi:hypothetical protein
MEGRRGVFRLIAGKAPHMETLLHHYAYGKPKELIEQAGNLKSSINVPWLSSGDQTESA